MHFIFTPKSYKNKNTWKYSIVNLRVVKRKIENNWFGRLDNEIGFRLKYFGRNCIGKYFGRNIFVGNAVGLPDTSTQHRVKIAKI